MYNLGTAHWKSLIDGVHVLDVHVPTNAYCTPSYSTYIVYSSTLVLAPAGAAVGFVVGSIAVAGSVARACGMGARDSEP